MHLTNRQRHNDNSALLMYENRRKQRNTGRQCNPHVNSQETWILSLFCQKTIPPFISQLTLSNLCNFPGYPSCSVAVVMGANVAFKTQVLGNGTKIMAVKIRTANVCCDIFSKSINFSRLQFLCMNIFIYNTGIFLFIRSVSTYQASTLYQTLCFVLRTYSSELTPALWSCLLVGEIDHKHKQVNTWKVRL